MERLTARSPKNNMAYLVKVKPDEQDVESPYPNTLRCIIEAFERLAKYEDSGLSPEEIVRLNDFEKSQCAKLLAENGLLKEAAKRTAEILQDMVDVANVSGSACLYRRDTGKVIEAIAAIDKAGGERV